VNTFLRIISKSSKFLNNVSGVILVLMMLVTVTDVVFRYLGRPLTGTYELMAFALALVVGFAIAQTSMDDAHINMDMVTEKLPPDRRAVLLVITKAASVILFALISWALFVKGHDLHKGKEVSLTLRVPFYPVAYAFALCSLIECFVLIADIIRIVSQGGEND
jgi:TRAP-type C4-dicarboxylate transport system permease small subunit